VHTTYDLERVCQTFWWLKVGGHLVRHLRFTQRLEGGAGYYPGGYERIGRGRGAVDH